MYCPEGHFEFEVREATFRFWDRLALACSAFRHSAVLSSDIPKHMVVVFMVSENDVPSFRFTNPCTKGWEKLMEVLRSYGSFMLAEIDEKKQKSKPQLVTPVAQTKHPRDEEIPPPVPLKRSRRVYPGQAPKLVAMEDSDTVSCLSENCGRRDRAEPKELDFGDADNEAEGDVDQKRKSKKSKKN